MRTDDDPDRLLPVGTRVVVRGAHDLARGEGCCVAGAVGEIVACPLDPLHAYRVRLVDGGLVSLRRPEFVILREHQRPDGAAVRSLEDRDLARYVIYRCVVGSRAYGLDLPGSDTDRRGIYLPPAERHWSLFAVPEQLEDEAEQECYWEVQKFLDLALKSNPNVLECLWTPLVEHATPIARELLSMRDVFLSKLAYQTYNGYVLSQFKKLAQGRRVDGAIHWKPVMHLVRLLLQGIVVLREGRVAVRVEEHRERLLAIKRGEVAWEDVDLWRIALHEELDLAYASTGLPDRPDYAAANAFLLRARRSALDT